MPSIRFGQYEIVSTWVAALLAVVGISLFVALGQWQWQRAEEKSGMLRLYNERMQEDSIFWHSGEALPLQYQGRLFTGSYKQPVFLLDNQYFQHQWGYHVLSPFWLNKHTVVMVDRGWVEGDALRQVLPKIATPVGRQRLKGRVYYPSVNRWIKQESLSPVKAGKIVIEQFSAKLLLQVLQQDVLPFIIRLDPTEPNGFSRSWQIVSMPPERHIAYAVQWFAFALLVVVIYVGLHFRRHYTNE